MATNIKYFSPIPVTSYGFASLILVTIGLLFTALFCVYNSIFII